MRTCKSIELPKSLRLAQFTLIDMIDVVLSLKEAGMPVDVIAQTLEREPARIEALLVIARDPVARVLLNAERLLAVDTWRMFMALPPVMRKRLLDSDEPITVERCDRLALDPRETSPRTLLTRHIPKQAKERRT